MFAILIFRFGARFGIAAGIITFSSVLLHELGHALVAQKFGIRIASIDLHVLGGMALMTRSPERPRDEVLIAAAGPIVSLVLGLSIGFVLTFLGSWPAAEDIFGEPTLIGVLAYAALVNLGMAIFNLVPALPMDGGRIFRAALASRLGPVPATRIAAWVSRGFGVCFILLGVTQDALSPMLIGVMLFMMVKNEERLVRMQEAMRARAAMGWRGAFPGFASRGRGFAGEGPVVDGATGEVIRETREEFVDPFGRRYVVVTRIVD